MTRLRNRVTLIGRLGADPETKTFDNGKSKVSFNLATTQVYKTSEGDKKEETQWHRIAVWNGLGEIAQEHLKKGREVAVEGKIAYFNFKDKDGQERNGVEIVADDFLFLGKPSA